MALPSEQQADLQAQLRHAIIACNERCLYFAAKWSAELLNSFQEPDSDPSDSSDTEIDDDDGDVPRSRPISSAQKREARLEVAELPRYLLAKSFFDCKEFDRCAAVFLPRQVSSATPSHQITPTKLQATPSKADGPFKPTAFPSLLPSAAQSVKLPAKLSQKSLFLALYARYLAGEKRKNEESETILGPVDEPASANKELPGVLAILQEYFQRRGGLQNPSNYQGWLEYLYGIVLARSSSEPLAKQWLLQSVHANPFNWSAWLELASLLATSEEVDQVKEYLPRHIMTGFFLIHCSVELYQQDPEIYRTIKQMQTIFPRSAFLQQQHALLLYHARDHDNAMQIFDNLLRMDQYRLDGMEVYSNLLFVLPSRPKMATLAAMASETDKFRPETNCILGNYYSLIGEHEKAVLHFRRALTLDRNYQAAWTLMGHEYVELKNTQAAIESYRRAVDVNRKDYRGWYGLGQGYEMLECFSYSIFYYQRATSLCPGDPKMWAALGNAYGKCSKNRQAIQAFKRALVVGSQLEPGSSFGSGTSDPLANATGGVLDPQILYEIAILYEKESKYDEAAAYMELTLAQEEGPEEGVDGLGVTNVTSKARLWLARWSYGLSDWQRTMELANELCQDGVEVEEAKSLVRDVRARMNLNEEEEDTSMNQGE